MDVKPEEHALNESANYADDEIEVGNDNHLAEGWNWNWKEERGERENEKQEKDEDSDTHTQNLPTPSDAHWEAWGSESSDGDDKYYEPIGMPLTWVQRHDREHWEQRTHDRQSSVNRTEIMLFSPRNEPSNDIYDPRPFVAPTPKEGRNLRFWMLGKTSEPQVYLPKPIGESPLELFCPVTVNRATQPAVLHVMDYLTQHDVDMVRATSKTLRASWPEEIMGKTAYCEMVLPVQNFNKTISRNREQPEGVREVCGSRREHAVIPCQGNELGIANHGPGHDICERCHISTLWDMRQAQRYVFGRHKRLRICQYCRIKFGPATEIQQFCRCEDSIANSRLCWDCRRMLIWRTWCRNNKNEQGPCLPNNISIRGSKFPHCDQTGECNWCLHFTQLKKYGECNQAFCIHCPAEKNYGEEEEEEEEEAVAAPPTSSEPKPNLEDDQLLFNGLHDDFHRYEAYEETECPDCPVCGIDIDGLRLQNEEGTQNPMFREKYAFLCLACGDVCGSNQLKGDFSVSQISVT